MILLEGVRAAVLPCSLAVLLPGLVVALAGRLRTPAVVTFAGTTALAMWARGVGLTVADGGVVQVAAAVTLAAGVAAAGGDPGWSRVLGGVATGAVSTLLWVPCVGRELGAELVRRSVL